jgi:hypothetical protein
VLSMNCAGFAVLAPGCCEKSISVWIAAVDMYGTFSQIGANTR